MASLNQPARSRATCLSKYDPRAKVSSSVLNAFKAEWGSPDEENEPRRVGVPIKQGTAILPSLPRTAPPCRSSPIHPFENPLSDLPQKRRQSAIQSQATHHSTLQSVVVLHVSIAKDSVLISETSERRLSWRRLRRILDSRERPSEWSEGGETGGGG